MEAGESSINDTSEMDGWTLIKDHSDDGLIENPQNPNTSFIFPKSTKGGKLTGAAKRKTFKKRSDICSSPPPPFNYHVTVEPEISGHDTIIRITKICDDDSMEDLTESKYFEIDDDGDEIIYLSDSPPPVEKPVKQKRKRSRKRKMNLETIHEHDSPPLRPPAADQADSRESDDDIVILPKQSKRQKLEKSPKLAQEKKKDDCPGEESDVVLVPKKSKKQKVIKLTHVPREEKEDEKTDDERETPKAEDDVMLRKVPKQENMEKPSTSLVTRGEGSESLDGEPEPVIIPKRNKKRKSKENESKRIVAKDNFDLSAPSWTVTVELDDDNNYKVIGKDAKPEETSTSPEVIASTANALLKMSEDSPKVVVIQPPLSKQEQGLSDSQSPTEKGDDDNASVVSVDGEENSGVVEMKVVKLENGKRSKTMCVCPCGMMFSHRSGLSRHRRIVHLGMTYRCQMCGEHFTRSDSLNDHIRRLEHWNQQINNLSPSTTPKRGTYKEFESQGERNKPGKPGNKKNIINYEIVKNVLADGTETASLIEKNTPSKNNSDSKRDDVQAVKESASGDQTLGENTENSKAGLVSPEVSDNRQTELPQQTVVSPKDVDSDEASSSIYGKDYSVPGGGSVGETQAKSDDKSKSDKSESTATSKDIAGSMKELSPPPVEATPAVVSTGTRKLSLSSSVEDRSERTKPSTLIKEILCCPPISVSQTTDVPGQKPLEIIGQKNTGKDLAEVHKEDIDGSDVSAPLVSKGLSEKNADGKPRIIVWPTTNESKDSWKNHPSLTKVYYPAPQKAVLPSTPLSVALSPSLKTLAPTSTAVSPLPTTVTASQQSMVRSAPQSMSVLKDITSSMSGTRLPGVWTITPGVSTSQPVPRPPASIPTPQMPLSKTCVSVQPTSLKPNTAQMLVPSSAPKALALSAKAQLPTQVPSANEIVLPLGSHVLVQSVMPTAQSSLATAQPSVPTAQPSVPTTQLLVPTAQMSAPTAQPSVPTAQPSVPTAQTSVPTAQLSVLTAQPSVPTAQPLVPTAQMSALTAQPSAPTAQPSVPTAQTSVPTVQMSVPTAQPSVPTAQTSAPTAQTSAPTAKCTLSTADAPPLSATQSSLPQAVLSSAPLLLPSAQPTPTVSQPPQLFQTPVTLSTPLLTIQQLVTTPSDALTSSPLPTNPTHALMETLLHSLMNAPIRTMSQPEVEVCTSGEIEIPATEAGSKETTQEVIFVFADALSEK